MKECNICYEEKEEKEVKDITCCKGKKWCHKCETKTKEISNKCPFCRHIFKLVANPNLDNGIYTFSLSPVAYEPSGTSNRSRIEPTVTLNPSDQLENMLLYPDSNMYG